MVYSRRGHNVAVRRQANGPSLCLDQREGGADAGVVRIVAVREHGNAPKRGFTRKRRRGSIHPIINIDCADSLRLLRQAAER